MVQEKAADYLIEHQSNFDFDVVDGCDLLLQHIFLKQLLPRHFHPLNFIALFIEIKCLRKLAKIDQTQIFSPFRSFRYFWKWIHSILVLLWIAISLKNVLSYIGLVLWSVSLRNCFSLYGWAPNYLRSFNAYFSRINALLNFHHLIWFY